MEGRSEPSPAIVQEELRAHGILRHDVGMIQNVSLAITREPYLPDPEAHRCVADVGPHRDRELDGFLRGSLKDPQFSGRSPGGADVDAEFRFLRASGGRIDGEVQRVDVNLTEAEHRPEAQTVAVRLTPTSVLLPTVPHVALSYTGEVRQIGEDEEPRPHQRVPTELGSWEISLQYAWADAEVGGAKANLRIPCATATMLLKADQCVRHIGRLVEDVLSQLEPACDVLSFLSRRLVRPWEVRVYSRGDGWYMDSRRILRPISTPEPSTLWPLVWGGRIPEDGIARVVDELGRTPYRDCILPTTHALIGFWRREFIETGVFTTFSALETLVNGMSRVDGTLTTLSDDDFGPVARVVKGAVKEAARAQGHGPEVRARLYEKIPELQRRSLVPRVCDAVERCGVEWRDLFGQGTELESELRDAYHRRSRLVHEGAKEDLLALMRDSRRVHALTERLVYRLLGVPVEWTEARSHEYAFWHEHHDQ